MFKNLFIFKKEKKGFTLIELLAVIVILGIIMALIIPEVTKTIEKSQIKSAENSVRGLMRAVDIAQKENALDGDLDTITFTYQNGNESSSVGNLKLDYTGKRLQDGKVVIDADGNIALALYDGKYCIEKDFTSDDIIITKTLLDDCAFDIPVYYTDASGANPPELLTGMTPIKWDDNNNEVNTTEDDLDWYNYQNQKWANAKTVDGSYWVWIPRYAYQIEEGFHQTTENPKINIVFLGETSDEPRIELNDFNLGDSPVYADIDGEKKQTNYVVHPAFNFSNDPINSPNQIEGFWVAKFETSVADQTNLCVTTPKESNCNKTTLIPKIIPNVNSWSYIQVGNMYTVSQNMKSNPIYGWNENEVDTHMMKNMEWGAVAYLSQSQYGKGTELGHNGSSFTGGTDYKTNVDQSTTGTIYGIYDMNGGKYEYVMGNYNKTNGAAGFGENGTTDINDIPLKYINLYSSYDDTKNKYGDAIYETSKNSSGTTSWHVATSLFITSNYPWLVRGGGAGDSGAGVVYFDNGHGGGGDNYSFRPVALR